MTLINPLRLAVLLLPGLGISGCSALGDNWPNLAGDPPSESVALLDPVELPDPSPLYTDTTIEEARVLLEKLPALIADLDQRIADQTRLYQQARNARERDTDIKMAGTAQRTAEFQLSRLSILETESSRLLRQAQSMNRALATTEEAEKAMALTKTLAKKTDRLTALLSSERAYLAGSGAENP